MAKIQSPSAETASSETADKKTASQKSRKRLNLDLSPEAYELLKEIVDDSGKSMAEVLRTGLALYGIAQEERKKGRKLTISEDDKVIKEIVAL